MARNGKYIPYGKYGDCVLVQSKRVFTGEKRKYYLTKSNQIICGINKTRTAVNNELRAMRGLGALPEHGDKVICTVNHWEQFIDKDYRYNLVNGIIGTVIDPFYDFSSGIGFMQFKVDFLNELCPEALPFDMGIFTDGRYRYKHGDYFEKFNEDGEAAGAFT